MKTRTSIVLSTLQTVQLFMDTNASALGSINTSSSRKNLDDLESTLRSHAASQTQSASGGIAAVSRQRVLRNSLVVKYLRPISAIAEAQLNQAPDFLALKLPRGLKTTSQYIAAADAMGAAAVNHADTFIKAGMAPTFLADLKTAANDLQAGAASRAHTVNSRIGATGALAVATREAHKVVKALDALIEPALANSPSLLTQWKATKRFTGRPSAIASATIDSTATVTVPAEGAPPAAAVPPAPAVSVAPAAPVTPVQAPPAHAGA